MDNYCGRKERIRTRTLDQWNLIANDGKGNGNA